MVISSPPTSGFSRELYQGCFTWYETWYKTWCKTWCKTFTWFVSDISFPWASSILIPSNGLTLNFENNFSFQKSFNLLFWKSLWYNAKNLNKICSSCAEEPSDRGLFNSTCFILHATIKMMMTIITTTTTTTTTETILIIIMIMIIIIIIIIMKITTTIIIIKIWSNWQRRNWKLHLLKQQIFRCFHDPYAAKCLVPEMFEIYGQFRVGHKIVKHQL